MSQQHATAGRVNRYLEDDVQIAIRNCAADNSQFNRRTLVRTIFACWEAMVFAMKRSCYDWAVAAKKPMSVLALLKDEAYNLDDKGEAGLQAKFLPLHQSFRFTVTTWIDVTGIDLQVDFSGAGWNAFKQAVRIRNRITHPKTAECSQLSDADMLVCQTAYQWATPIIDACWDKRIKQFEERARRAEEAAAKATAKIVFNLECGCFEGDPTD